MQSAGFYLSGAQKRTCSFYSPPALCYLCARYERNELTV